METIKINKKLITIIVIILLVITGITYGYTRYIVEYNNTFTSGQIKFIYTENTENIELLEQTSVKDEEGKIMDEYFSFNISAAAVGKTKISYYIYFTEDNANTLKKDAIKLYLSKVENESDKIEDEIEVIKPMNLSLSKTVNQKTLKEDKYSNEFFIHSDEFNLNNDEQRHNYRLRIWIDDDYSFNDDLIYNDIENGTQVTINKKTFKLKINVIGHSGDKLIIN